MRFRIALTLLLVALLGCGCTLLDPADGVTQRASSDSLTLPAEPEAILEPEFPLRVLAADTRLPIAGAQVQLGDRLQTTDTDGYFALHAVKPGTLLRIQAAGYAPREWTLVPATADILLLEPLATPTPTAAPTRTRIPTLTPTATSTGTATPTPSPTPTETATAAPTSEEQVPPPSPVPSTPRIGGTLNPLRLQFEGPTRSGTLRDAATGRPIPGADLWLDGTQAVSDAQGRFQFANVPAGDSSTLVVKLAGYRLHRFAVSAESKLNETLPPFRVRGLHLYYGMSREWVLAHLEMSKDTEINTMIIDVKSDRGEIAWRSSVPLARQVGASAERGIDLRELIRECRARGLYCIARTVIMKDDKVAYARNDLALHTANGAVYADTTAAWLNPAKREVHDYAVALARELVALGFDEVQIDYIRYPGRFGAVEVGTSETRVALITQLVAAHQAAFRTLPAFLSADVFGLTTFTDDANSIGQRLRDISRYVDYISPMVYPDTYNAGMLGALGIPDCAVPRVCPYQTVYQNVKHAQTRTFALLRIWIQAYGWTTAEYLQERKAAEEADSYGWMWWNNEGAYDPALFRKR